MPTLWTARPLSLAVPVSAPAAPASAASPRSPSASSETDAASSFTTTLAEHIRTHDANGNQVKRFLVTADWLRRKGQPLTTANVKKALTDNHQLKIPNPGDALNKNVTKGHIEKDGGGFYISPSGKTELGYAE